VLLARVVGTVVATRKDEGLHGVKLLVIQPLRTDRSPAGKPLVAVDSVGAGAGEDVFYVRGREASFPFLPAEVPADAAIIGIVDHWSLG
jgi:microcompartment protein CcmK/EutM